MVLVGCQPRSAGLNPLKTTPSPQTKLAGHREYLVHEQISLVNNGPGQPEKQNIWVALIRDFAPYQTVQSMVVTPNKYKLVIDEFGNHYAEFDFSGQPAGTTQIVQIDYRVSVNELSYDLSGCQGALPTDFTQPELHIESANPQIVDLAKTLAKNKPNVCEKIRAFYNYIGDNLVYTPNGQNWGAQAALGPMGADCTEYSDLLVALSRAQGIPARYFEGVLYLDKTTDAIAKTEHAWVDVYMPSVGWVGMDPTLGRSPGNRVTYFAHYTPDHIIVTVGASPSVLRGEVTGRIFTGPGTARRYRYQEIGRSSLPTEMGSRDILPSLHQSCPGRANLRGWGDGFAKKRRMTTLQPESLASLAQEGMHDHR